MTDQTDFNSRLQVALDDTIREFNRTRDPDASIAKIASESGFTPAGSQRLLETFNRALTIFHFNKGEDKTAEFTLADPGRVARLMYSEPDKKHSVSEEEKVAMASFYDQPEQDFTVTPEQLFSEKMASEEIPPALPIENLYHRVMMQRGDFTKAASLAADLANTAETFAEQKIEKIARDLLLDSKDAAILRVRFSEYKEACRRDPLLSGIPDMVAGFLGKNYDLSTPPGMKFASVMDTKAIDPYLKLSLEAGRCLQKVAVGKAVIEGIKRDSDEFEAAVGSLLYREKKAEVEEPDFLLKRSAAPDGNGAKPQAPQPSSKPVYSLAPDGGMIDSVAKATGSQILKGMGNYLDTDVYRMTQGGQMERDNKALTNTATNLHRQLMLEDILTSDPILSEADPEAVVTAYQSLLRLAPEVANQKATVVSILRQSIHSQDAFSPYDAEQVTKLNMALKNVRGGSAPGKKMETR